MSELGKRIVSGILLAAALLAVLWLGSWWFVALLAIAAIVVYREYARMIWRGWSGAARWAWLAFGLLYVGFAIRGLWFARSQEDGMFAGLLLFFAVWATDTGAYIAGRAIGGPKIAPRISPKKTWAGLGGAIVATCIVVFAMASWKLGSTPLDWGWSISLFGIAVCGLVSVVAQAGDFFESWLKRRAGMKDSGGIIPGHGGLFDRIDGLLPVAALFPAFAQLTYSS